MRRVRLVGLYVEAGLEPPSATEGVTTPQKSYADFCYADPPGYTFSALCALWIERSSDQGPKEDRTNQSHNTQYLASLEEATLLWRSYRRLRNYSVSHPHYIGFLKFTFMALESRSRVYL